MTCWDRHLGRGLDLWCSSFVLGGLSLVGPPLLLMTARRSPWGAGPAALVYPGSGSLVALAARRLSPRTDGEPRVDQRVSVTSTARP